MARMRGKKNLRRPRLYGRTSTYNLLTPRAKPMAVLFYKPPRLPRLAIWSLGEERGGSTRPFRAGPSAKQSHLGDKLWSTEAQKDSCLVCFQQNLHQVVWSHHGTDCPSYQVKLPSLHAPGLLVQPLLFISCCELDCGLQRLSGPAGPGAPMSLLAVV